MTTPIAIPQDPEKIRQASQKVWPHIDDETPTSLVQHIANLHTFLAHYQALLNASPDPEPFDLARAKAGEAVQTRGGLKVELIKFDLDHSQPLLGVIQHPNGQTAEQWCVDGCFYVASNNNPYDLLMYPRPVEQRIMLLNVFKDNSISIWDTQEKADLNGYSRIACIPVAVPEGRKG